MKSGSKKPDTLTQRLFRNPSGQEEMFDKSLEEELEEQGKSVECLGQHFVNDAARREYYLAELTQKLNDPDFRKIEGFPVGSDDDILSISDPPFYTACPNPFLKDFISLHGRPYDPNVHYSREPFAADVSEGKSDPVYNAHSYHTKVPHKAIMRYVLHYTEPGDLIFDGFCGTGMTGVAAQMCGDQTVVESLGYRVGSDGTIFQQETDDNGVLVWKPFSRLGVRQAVLNDLSPAATFIAHTYNTPVDVTLFEREAKRILADVVAECGWMYETTHTDGKTKCEINYTVWSDVFVCPECADEVVFWEASVDKEAGRIKEDFPCPHCGVMLTKRRMARAWVTRYDRALKQTIRQSKQVPVLINYSLGGKRMEKLPGKNDLALIATIENSDIPYWFPTDRMIEGSETRRNDPFGITHVHHFYTQRNLWTLSALRSRMVGSTLPLWFWVNAAMRYLSRMSKLGTEYYFHGGGGAVNAGILGTLYIPSFSVENNVIDTLKTRLPKLCRVLRQLPRDFSCISCQSTTGLDIAPDSFDYVFIDPPFGSNLSYSELSFHWETWAAVLTNTSLEAIENRSQGKGLSEYRKLMSDCFKEAYRILKPGRWMTVEFSNTNAAVWNSIQTALAEAGFIVANVSALDKQQGSFKAVTTPTAVKQDLVISAYKPNGGFEARFQQEATEQEGVWDFVRTHLKYLPVTKRQGALLQVVPERDPRILFDQMIAYYVRRGFAVPISSQEFQEGLAQRFIERDGMYFLSEQAAEYDRKKMTAGVAQQTYLFVSDESSAIQWLRARLKTKPQMYSEIQPDFMPLLSHLNKNERELLSLDLLLQENFLRYDGSGEVPSQIHSYLSTNFKDLRKLPKDAPELQANGKDRWYVPDPNKAGDLEKLRERSLLKEFEELRNAKQKKLKVFRIEAVRAGFKRCWQQNDYSTIVAVAERLPEDVLQEDPMLLMWYTNGLTRTGRQA
jgi:hypothetical protein